VVKGKPNETQQAAEGVPAHSVNRVSLRKPGELAGTAAGAFDKPSEDDEKRAPPDILSVAAMSATKDGIKEDLPDKISPLSVGVTSTRGTDGHYLSEARMY